MAGNNECCGTCKYHVPGEVPEEEIVICKLCGQPEFWNDMRWLNGKCMCRECYKSEYEDFYGKYYKWDDLNGTRPTREAYERQEKMKQRFKEIDEFFDSLSNEEFAEIVKECIPEGEVRT